MFLGYYQNNIKYYVEHIIDEPAIEKWEETQDEYVLDGDEYVLNDDEYKTKQTAKRQAEFNKAFFLTSLGYIRRSVSMADGSKKDFLSDLLPTIAMGVNGGATVPIITYSQPPFDRDIEDWTEYQTVKNVNAQFIQDCFKTLSNDFIPSN